MTEWVTLQRESAEAVAQYVGEARAFAASDSSRRRRRRRRRDQRPSASASTRIWFAQCQVPPTELGSAQTAGVTTRWVERISDLPFTRSSSIRRQSRAFAGLGSAAAMVRSSWSATAASSAPSAPWAPLGRALERRRGLAPAAPAQGFTEPEHSPASGAATGADDPRRADAATRSAMNDQHAPSTSQPPKARMTTYTQSAKQAVPSRICTSTGAVRIVLQRRRTGPVRAQAHRGRGGRRGLLRTCRGPSRASHRSGRATCGATHRRPARSRCAEVRPSALVPLRRLC